MFSENTFSDRYFECIPNFSEGRDASIIFKIQQEIQSIPGVKILHVDIGYDANRTVITFICPAETIVQAGFAAYKAAAQFIDMRNQSGVHPRIGALDVFPIVPLKNTTLSDADKAIKAIAVKVGTELKIPIYFYAESALFPERKSFPFIRKGEYECFAKKMTEGFIPDAGPSQFNLKTGASAAGARQFMLAYNVNLNTTDADAAEIIAAAVRESGIIINGTRKPGLLTGCQAKGWLIKEYSMAQVTMNLHKINQAGFYEAFHAVRCEAKKLGIETRGSELIGLTPLAAILDAGKKFEPELILEEEIINAAINHLGLNSVNPFLPSERIIEIAAGIL